eukprot:scaffold105638_cov32-Tisochrysis_lutea.AAC.1
MPMQCRGAQGSEVVTVTTVGEAAGAGAGHQVVCTRRSDSRGVTCWARRRTASRSVSASKTNLTASRRMKG